MGTVDTRLLAKMRIQHLYVEDVELSVTNINKHTHTVIHAHRLIRFYCYSHFADIYFTNIHILNSRNYF